MTDKVIDNPILNRPYDEPSRHFAFDDEGITDRIEDSRRPSSYFVPVPQPRKGTRQLELTELTADQIRLNELVNRVREARHAVAPRRLPSGHADHPAVAGALGRPGAGEPGAVLPAGGC